jgi:hypothetical protein
VASTRKHKSRTGESKRPSQERLDIHDDNPATRSEHTLHLKMSRPGLWKIGKRLLEGAFVNWTVQDADVVLSPLLNPDLAGRDCCENSDLLV